MGTTPRLFQLFFGFLVVFCFLGSVGFAPFHRKAYLKAIEIITNLKRNKKKKATSVSGSSVSPPPFIFPAAPRTSAPAPVLLVDLLRRRDRDLAALAAGARAGGVHHPRPDLRGHRQEGCGRG
jgi:hypothetical protein